MRTRHDDWLEGLAVGASFVCLVHCLALPFLIAALPAMTATLEIPESFHVWALVFAVPASGFALLTGRARHGAWWPIMLGVVGLVLLMLGALRFGGTPLDAPVTVAGSLILALAHYANWRLRQTAMSR
ncbi:MAG: MerC domain-containing protein [Sphingomonas sp.]